jgi:hypothetical protein
VVDCDKVQENMVCVVGENVRNGEKLKRTNSQRYRSKTDEINTWTSLRGKRPIFVRENRVKELSV